MEPAAARPQVRGVADDLREVARRLTYDAFGRENEYPDGGLDALPLEYLGPVIEHCRPDLWSVGRREADVGALEATLRQGIERLTGRFGRLPSKGESDGQISNEEAALRYFNLDGSARLDHIRKIDVDDAEHDDKGAKRHDKVLFVLREISGVEKKSTFRRKLLNLRLQLAKVLIDIAYGPEPAAAQSPLLSKDASSLADAPVLDLSSEEDRQTQAQKKRCQPSLDVRRLLDGSNAYAHDIAVSNGLHVTRTLEATLLDKLKDSNNVELRMLVGKAGSGKSTLLWSLHERLSKSR